MCSFFFISHWEESLFDDDSWPNWFLYHSRRIALICKEMFPSKFSIASCSMAVLISSSQWKVIDFIAFFVFFLCRFLTNLILYWPWTSSSLSLLSVKVIYNTCLSFLTLSYVFLLYRWGNWWLRWYVIVTCLWKCLSAYMLICLDNKRGKATTTTLEREHSCCQHVFLTTVLSGKIRVIKSE